jgi:protein O-GlcNAc transferase
MPASNAQQIDRAHELLINGKLDAAERLLNQVIRADPDAGLAFYYLGLIDYQRKHFSNSAGLIERAIECGETDPAVYNNLGMAFLGAEEGQKAINAFDRAIGLDGEYVMAWFNRGTACDQLNLPKDAQNCYEKALTLDPYLALAHNNLGLVHQRNGDLTKAVSCFEECLRINPDYNIALNNLGFCQQLLGLTDVALNFYSATLKISPKNTAAHVNAGNLLQLLGRYEEASLHYQSALKLAPELDLLIGNLMFCKAMICDWREYKAQWRQIEKKTSQGLLPCSPFALLSGCDDGKLALKLAQRYAERHVHVPSSITILNPNQLSTQDRSSKLRIGYISSDFKEHPVAYLMVGIIENHNRDVFEVVGFSIAKPGDDPLGQRICKSFDRFVDVSSLSDQQVIEEIRSHKIDIAIDLNGYIDGCRPGIFKARIAPVQINYYGYPGTMGADFMDYIVGDKNLMPPGSEAHYREKIIYLPESYQPNDDRRPISDLEPSRTDQGLPEDAFVFCCFNKPYKITPSVFECWMSVLAAIPNGVLWLQSNDITVRSNLRQSATRLGINPDRLVFAIRVPTTAEHLARYRLADLFLDTYPYTAHTTANDALWADLPVLGITGETFSARVSESLLSALDLSDLVMRTIPEYQARAIALAQNQNEVLALRTRLIAAKKTKSLFQPLQITRWLEAGFIQTHNRNQKGLAPEHIVVPLDEI